eukprot:jgi/Mesvir1/22591/Mv05012-RA.1
MSVVGLDIGNDNSVVALARRKGIDVVLNDESKRETPSMVAFTEKQRFLGNHAATGQTMNPKNTICNIKRLLGRKFNDPMLQKELPLLPFQVREGPGGVPEVVVQYLGETRAFTPAKILAMLLGNLKAIAEKDQGNAITDFVLGCPVYFTDAQRRDLLDAAAIAGISVLRLLHETTATALGYGIFKTDLPEKDPVNVVFVDVGHASLQVCVAAFQKGKVKILSSAFDDSLGGRDFDKALVDHFVAEIKEKHKTDVSGQPRAMLRLLAACEKLKKILSANAEGPLNVESLTPDLDFRSLITRDLFEQLAQPVLQRVVGPLQRALEQSGLTKEQVSSVELVGSSTRIPALVKLVEDFFGRPPQRTMNSSESVARGCALQAAMLSPAFKVREFEIIDSFPFTIRLAWSGASPTVEEGDSMHPKEGEAEGEDAKMASSTTDSVEVFTQGCAFPSTKMLTFFRKEAFHLEAFYATPEQLPHWPDHRIGSFAIGPFKVPAGSEKAKIKVRVKLNLHGVLLVESAQVYEEEEYDAVVEKPKAAPAAAKPAAASPPPPAADASGPSPMAEDGGAQVPDASGAPAADAGAAAAAPPVATDAAPMEVATEVVRKKRTRKTDVPIASTSSSLSEVERQAAIEKEYEMRLQDRVMEETKDKKNEVEAYVYDMRAKLSDRLDKFVTEAERESFSRKLTETEDWLYEEGEDESKGVYINKLEELRKMGDPLLVRVTEDEGRPAVMAHLRNLIAGFRAIETDPAYEHIDAEQKKKVLDECATAAAWLDEKQAQQAAQPLASAPAFLCNDVQKKADVLDRVCRPILNTPKPKPKVEPKPEPAPQPEVKMEEGAAPAPGASAAAPDATDAEMGDAEPKAPTGMDLD